MAKVQCKYCGSYIEDTLEVCDVCGAKNEFHRRLTNDTPKTIEELKSWYIARNLPPEETTRFFISKDIREPKAFGIYEKHGKFIVYKNKANGQRAIRYEGTDEAYAVNELYLKLKEEILRQKTINLNNKQAQSTSPTNNYSRYTYNSNKYNNRRKKTRYRSPFFTILFIWIFMFIFVGTGIGIVFLKNADLFLPSYYSYYYLDNSNQVYYCQNEDDGDDTWWLYNKESKEWSVYKVLPEDEFPEGVVEDTRDSSHVGIAIKLDLDSKDLDINYSRKFIDAGNHKKPSSAYYYHNDKLY